MDWRERMLITSNEKGAQRGMLKLRIILIIVSVVVLVAVAVPTFLMYWEWKSNKAAKEDIQDAFIAAQTYFAEYPDKTVTYDILKTNGYRQSEGVTLTILNGTIGGLQITSKHIDGNLTYTVDESGGITSSLRPSAGIPQS
jgi:hypothetical protein